MEKYGAVGVDGGTRSGVMRLFGGARAATQATFPLVGVVAAPWIARTATVIAAAAPSITVLVNGGQIAYADVQKSVETDRRVVVIAGSGRTADVFVSALASAPADERAATLVKSGLIRSVPIGEPGVLAESLTATLGESAAK
jgi:hypothetical protein